MRIFILGLVVGIMLGCDNPVNKKNPSVEERIDSLAKLYLANLDKVWSFQSEVHGWIVEEDCDSMLWNGKLNAAYGVRIDTRASESPSEPGRFYRRPSRDCWVEGKNKNDSASTWSRDMSLGLLQAAWADSDLKLLEDHVSYGKSRETLLKGVPVWQMGEPVADGRTFYWPPNVGLFYKAIFGLGGEANAAALWPDYWAKDLKDFHAHLQVMTIYLQGEIADVLNDEDAMPKKPEVPALLSISSVMYDRLREHAEREPECGYYQAVHGLYSGYMSPAIKALLDEYKCEYLRCSNYEECYLADWLHSATIVLNAFNKLPMIE
jgi:hypothetical protein